MANNHANLQMPDMQSPNMQQTENKPQNIAMESSTQHKAELEESISPESKYQRRLKLYKHLEWLFSQEKLLNNQQIELIQHDFQVSQLELLFNQQRALMDEIFYVLREQEQIGVIPELYQEFINSSKIDTMPTWMNRADGNYLGRDTLWMRRYEELTHFRSVHGHTNVTKVHTGYDSLANWVNQQRRLWRLGQLNNQRQKLLAQIGFEFDRRGVFQNPKPIGEQPKFQTTPSHHQQSPQIQQQQQHPFQVQQHSFQQQHPLQHINMNSHTSNIQLPPPSIQLPLKSQNPPSQQIPQANPIQSIPKPAIQVTQNQHVHPPPQSIPHSLPSIQTKPQIPPSIQNDSLIRPQQQAQPVQVPNPNQYSIQSPRPLQTQATPSSNSPPSQPFPPMQLSPPSTQQAQQRSLQVAQPRDPMQPNNLK